MSTALPLEGKIGDLDTRPKLTRKGSASYTGTRYFRVDTDDVVDAMLASGLPEPGDPFDAVRLPSCQAFEIGPAMMVKGKAASDGSRSGFCVIPVQYATRDLQVLPYDAGDAFTTWVNAVNATTVYFGLEASPLAINDGEGTSKRTGSVQAKVTKYYTEAQFNAKLPTFNEYGLLLPVNSDAFTLPPVRGFSTPYTFAYNESNRAFYLGYEQDVQGGLVVVTHTFEMGGSAKYLWSQRKSDGTVITPPKESTLYEERPFSGLL